MEKRLDQTAVFYTEFNETGLQLAQKQPYRSLNPGDHVACTDPTVGNVHNTFAQEQNKPTQLGVFYTDSAVVDPYASIKTAYKRQ